MSLIFILEKRPLDFLDQRLADSCIDDLVMLLELKWLNKSAVTMALPSLSNSCLAITKRDKARVHVCKLQIDASM
jgi:hypothetical protein